MILQGRNLRQGLTGSDVAELQTELNQLSYGAPSSEQQASSFGAGTMAAVKQFQTDQGLPSTGIVDETTAAALTTVIRSNTYVVTGTVSSPVSAGVTGLTLQLVDKNVGGDVSLASGQTGAGGGYTIKAVISTASLSKRNKTSPDLQVRVSSGNTFLAASAVRYNAPLNVTLDVLLPSNAAGLASEYESLTASLSALYTGRLSELQEGAQRQDVTFLANKSGWDARAVAMAALADQLSQTTAPAPAPSSAESTGPAATAAPATKTPPSTTQASAPPDSTSAVPAPAAPAAPATVSLAREFYYALLRAGIPADANSLFRTPATSVQAIWKQAIAQGVIPQALASQLPTAVQTYQTLSAANLLTATPVVGVSTLGAMLTASTLDAAQQTTFSQLYAQYGNDPASFWKNASASFGPALTSRLQLDGQLNYLSLNNAPLVTALYAAEANLTAPVDLVALGL